MACPACLVALLGTDGLGDTTSDASIVPEGMVRSSVAVAVVALLGVSLGLAAAQQLGMLLQERRRR